MGEEEKINSARFSVINNGSQLILGKDFGNVFKEGVVYSAQNINGEIVISEEGEYALTDNAHDTGAAHGSDINSIAFVGAHNLTKSEYRDLELRSRKNPNTHTVKRIEESDNNDGEYEILPPPSFRDLIERIK